MSDAAQALDNSLLLPGEQDMWANLRLLGKIPTTPIDIDPDVYPRLPLLISDHQGSVPAAGHASQRPAAAQPQFSNCSDYKSFINDYKSHKHTELFNFDKLTIQHKQFLFKYFYDIMTKIQQTLVKIPRSVEDTPGYREFERNYLTPLTVESTLTLETMNQEQQAYLFVYFYKKIVELGLTVDQLQEINSLGLCSESLGGKKKVKKTRVSKTKKMRRSLLSRKRRQRIRSHKRHRS